MIVSNVLEIRGQKFSYFARHESTAKYSLMDLKHPIIETTTKWFILTKIEKVNILSAFTSLPDAYCN